LRSGVGPVNQECNRYATRDDGTALASGSTATGGTLCAGAARAAPGIAVNGAEAVRL